MIWSEKQTTRLQDLWAKGLSGGQIATRLKTTRGAVLGKVRRLGLHRKNLVKKNPITVQKSIVGYVMARVPKLWLGVYDAVSQLKKEDCRWPIGDANKPDFKFCCKPKTPTGPYCQEHKAIAGVPQQKRYKP